MGTRTVRLEDDVYERLEAVVDALVHEPTTPSIVHRAGELEGRLAERDAEVGAVDVIVGATALAYGEPVVTADGDRFERMDGVDVRRY